jgi:nitrite reductase/ring-hydroxylating ferredoxin subunit
MIGGGESRAGHYSPGWYCVGVSTAVRPGDAYRVEAFGEALALFRGRSGELGLLADECPHYGLPLVGARGRPVVRDDCIQCPWHGWRWSASGSLRAGGHRFGAIPRVRIPSWPVREAGGLIFAHHARPGEPAAPWAELVGQIAPAAGPDPFRRRVDDLGLRPAPTGDQFVPAVAAAPIDADLSRLVRSQLGPGLTVLRAYSGDLAVTQLIATTPVDRDTVRVFSSISWSVLS